MKPFVLILMFFLLAAPASSTPDEVCDIVYFDSYMPYSWKDTSGSMKGILIDIMNETLGNRMGIPLTHSGYPWARAQNYVRSGEADAFVTVPTPERLSYVEASNESVIIATVSVYTYHNHPRLMQFKEIREPSDLKPFRHIQYLGNGWAKQNLSGMEIRWVPTVQDALNLLAKHQFDVFVDNAQVINFTIKQSGLQKTLTEVSSLGKVGAFHLCIGKTSPFAGSLSRFDSIIGQMKQSGELFAIINNYQ